MLKIKFCIKVVDIKKKKEIYDDFGEMLFTHFGVSGPMILSASAHMRDMEKERYEIYKATSDVIIKNNNTSKEAADKILEVF